MTALRRLPARRVRPGQRPGSSLSPVASTAHTVGASTPNLCRAASPRSLPGRAAQTQPTRAVPAAPRRPGPGAAALLAGGRFRRRGLRLGGRRRSRLVIAAVVLGGLVTSASTGPGGAPMGGATVVVPPGRAAASFRLAFAVCSFPAFTAWRPRLETASQPASRPSPTSGRHHGLRAALRRCLRRCRDITSTSRPRPADWVALLVPCSQGMKRTAARWRGASQASCDCLPPADPHRRRPRPLGLGQSSPVAEGLAPSSESMTTPSTRSRREPGCHQGRQPLHRHGLDPPRAHATAAWLGPPSPCRRSRTLARPGPTRR